MENSLFFKPTFSGTALPDQREREEACVVLIISSQVVIPTDLGGSRGNSSSILWVLSSKPSVCFVQSYLCPFNNARNGRAVPMS